MWNFFRETRAVTIKTMFQTKDHKCFIRPKKKNCLVSGNPVKIFVSGENFFIPYESTAITTELHPPQVWERFADDVYSILKRTHLKNFFHHINNLHQNIKFTMEEENTLLKRNGI